MLEKYFNFKNKVVLVTGCNGQIGQSITNLFSELGAIVYGVDKVETKKNNNFVFFKCDITNEKNLKKTIDKIIIKEKTVNENKIEIQLLQVKSPYGACKATTSKFIV